MAQKAAAGGSELISGGEKKKMLLRKLLREPTLVTKSLPPLRSTRRSLTAQLEPIPRLEPKRQIPAVSLRSILLILPGGRRT